jgi:peptidoglycan/LPS O-acetylase OafA/YrhL
MHFSPNWDRGDLRYDSLLTGALAALLAADPEWRGVVDRCLRRHTSLILIGALVVFFACMYWPFHMPGVIALLTIPLELWAVAIVILIVSSGRCRPAQSFLNAGPMAWLGRTSFSLYLWQEPFLRAAGGAIVKTFPINLAATFVAATISYNAIERPCARLRQRWRADAFKGDAAQRESRPTERL